jgi:hypothetical protein
MQNINAEMKNICFEIINTYIKEVNESPLAKNLNVRSRRYNGDIAAL